MIGKEYQKFSQVENLSDYAKVSDTTIYGNNYNPAYSILHLRNKSNNLVVFNSITHDLYNTRTYRLLDSLIIPNLYTPELITIGYCEKNQDRNENLIAIVDKSDSLLVEHIRHVWKADTNSKKIEKLKNLNGIKCYNELFEMN